MERPTSTISESMDCRDVVSHSKGLLAASRVSSVKAGRGTLSYRPAGVHADSRMMRACLRAVYGPQLTWTQHNLLSA